MTQPYSEEQPDRAEVDAASGPMVLEFGNDWCGHCRAAQPHIAEAFAGHAGIAHLKLADAREKRLGRSFGVKLWPTLVFLRNGREIDRVVRPRSAAEVADALAVIAGPTSG
ncbi:MAG: thioredoxin family protein [Pseudomonadota bacterium]|jgi:thioredoxin 1|nr:thioredoxin family protein [Pseudomonadota bacterium]